MEQTPTPPVYYFKEQKGEGWVAVPQGDDIVRRRGESGEETAQGEWRGQEEGKRLSCEGRESGRKGERRAEGKGESHRPSGRVGSSRRKENIRLIS